MGQRKFCWQRLGGDVPSPGCESPTPALTSRQPAPRGSQNPPCVKGDNPAQPTSSRGRCASQGDRHERALHAGRPSADVRVIIIISPPPGGMVVRAAPSSACQAPLIGPWGQAVRGTQAGAGCLLQAPSSAQLGPACSSPGLSSGARTQVAGSGWLLGGAPRAGGGSGGGGAAQPGTKAGWELAGRHQGSMHNGPGGWRLRSWTAFA